MKYNFRPGPRNLITDVENIRVGQAEDTQVWSGVSVLLFDASAVAAVDVRGGAPGTRDTDALNPSCLVDRIDAIVLSGGSVFGLGASSAVTDVLASRGIGFPIGPARAPIVPSAVLFDLLNGGNKSWNDKSPYAELGRKALDAASLDFKLGCAGAGYGAKAGPLKGGLGSASSISGDGLQVGAIVAVNCVGSPIMPGQSSFWAWPFEQANEMGGQPVPTSSIDFNSAAEAWTGSPLDSLAGENTTIGVVATNARLTKSEAQRVAIMAQDGYARSIRPVHTPFDGDTVFAASTGMWGQDIKERADLVNRIGLVAADCLARAVARGVYEATALGNFPSYRDVHGKNLRGK
ncbi:P1 family peptidase [Bdellovibrio bacteriovorus]|uniref:P1 family peptidase n=1 Tax=Bdellovibrio bacteriovorus TaxID=959 RepID=UPI0021CEA865|nr:P1 family peptidase [Bdellovibrio bacteriovorus]UXR63952.1 P1 family peptidase [Bdellovibrio bacteriovorus]